MQKAAPSMRRGGGGRGGEGGGVGRSLLIAFVQDVLPSLSAFELLLISICICGSDWFPVWVQPILILQKQMINAPGCTTSPLL